MACLESQVFTYGVYKKHRRKDLSNAELDNLTDGVIGVEILVISMTFVAGFCAGVVVGLFGAYLFDDMD